MDAVNSQNLALYVFSFNRGNFLDNCLKSVSACAPNLDTTIIDDQSDDPATVTVLAEYKRQFRLIRAEDGENLEHKTGGLYNNMRYAFRDARKRGFRYVLFLQDDMQLVRPLHEDDYKRISQYFWANSRSAELHTCFMKRFFAELDERYATLDNSGVAYLRPSDYPGFSGFSAVGLFNLERFDSLFGELRKGEYANNEYAQTNNIQQGFYAHPFMMWLPYPISHRGKRRNFPLRLIEGLAGCEFYPYRTMQTEDIAAMCNRDLSEKPYAEDWLNAPDLGRVPVWSFAGGLSNLYARGGYRAAIASFLQRFR